MANTTDINKLPQWAQRLINRLEQDNDSLRNQLRAVSEADSPVTWQTGLGDEHGIPRSAQVTFRMWKHHGIDVKLNSDGDVIRVSGSDAIRIRPAASNVVYIELESIDRIRGQVARENEAAE